MLFNSFLYPGRELYRFKFWDTLFKGIFHSIFLVVLIIRWTIPLNYPLYRVEYWFKFSLETSTAISIIICGSGPGRSRGLKSLFIVMAIFFRHNFIINARKQPKENRRKIICGQATYGPVL